MDSKLVFLMAIAALFAILLASLVIALIVSKNFRSDVIGGSSGEAKVFGILTVKGVVIVLLCAIFVGGILYTLAKVQNSVGSQGPQGPQGPPGIPGQKGDKGDPGQAQREDYTEVAVSLNRVQQNSGSRPIFIVCTCNAAPQKRVIEIRVGNTSQNTRTIASDSGVGERICASAVVPPGWFYYIKEVENNTLCDVSGWKL